MLFQIIICRIGFLEIDLKAKAKIFFRIILYRMDILEIGSKAKPEMPVFQLFWLVSLFWHDLLHIGYDIVFRHLAGDDFFDLAFWADEQCCW